MVGTAWIPRTVPELTAAIYCTRENIRRVQSDIDDALDVNQGPNIFDRAMPATATYRARREHERQERQDTRPDPRKVVLAGHVRIGPNVQHQSAIWQSRSAASEKARLVAGKTRGIRGLALDLYRQNRTREAEHITGQRGENLQGAENHHRENVQGDSVKNKRATR